MAFAHTAMAGVALLAGVSAAKFQVDVQYEGNCSAPVFATVANHTTTAMACSPATCSAADLTSTVCSEDADTALASVFGANQLMKFEAYAKESCQDLVGTHYLLADGRNHTANVPLTVVTRVTGSVTHRDMPTSQLNFSVASTNVSVTGHFSFYDGSHELHTFNHLPPFRDGEGCFGSIWGNNQTYYRDYRPKVPKPSNTSSTAHPSRDSSRKSNDSTGSKRGDTSSSSRGSPWPSTAIAGAAIIVIAMW